MAFFVDEEEKLDNNGMPISTGAQSAQLGSGGAQNSSAAPQVTPDNPGNFVGIKSYLDANKNQAEKLGDQTANVISTSANEAKQGLSDIQNKFNQQAVGVSADQDVLSKVNEAEKLSDQEKAKLKQQKDVQYTGPQDLTSLNDDYQKVGSQINKAFQNISGAGTEEGRMGLIQQVNSKPRNAGMDIFDNALLSSGGGREKIAQAAQSNKDVNNDLLSQANISATQKAADAKALTDTTRNQTQTALQGAQGSLGSSLQQRLQQLRQGVVDTNNKVTQDISDNPLDLEKDVMDLYGLSPNERIFGLDLNSYLNQASPSDLNEGNVASAEEYARSQALSDIMGGQGLLNPADVSKAGTAPKTAVDQQRLRADIEQANSQYQQAYAEDKNVWDKDFLSNYGLNSQGDISSIMQAGAPGDITKATPYELQNVWLPFVMQNPTPGYRDALVGVINDSLKKWNENKKYNNVVNKLKDNAAPGAPKGPAPVKG